MGKVVGCVSKIVFTFFEAKLYDQEKRPSISLVAPLKKTGRYAQNNLCFNFKFRLLPGPL